MHMQPDQFPSLDYKNLLSDISDSEAEVSNFFPLRKQYLMNHDEALGKGRINLNSSKESAVIF